MSVMWLLQLNWLKSENMATQEWINYLEEYGNLQAQN